MQKYSAYILLTCFLVCTAGFLFAQNTQTIFYTTKDGLPSNSIYKTVLDRNGFLWIATDNGLAKYDGKNFKTYSTAQGLPDNEITDIFIDSSNRIWVSPFRRTTSYYNPVNDRFENEDSDPALKKVELGNSNRGNVMQFGGVAFCNNLWDIYIYKNGQVITYKRLLDSRKSKTPEKIKLYLVFQIAPLSFGNSERFFNSNLLFNLIFKK